MSLPIILLALAIVAPQDGAVVSPHQPLHLSWEGPADAVYLVSVWRAGGANQSTAVSNRTDVYVANLELGTRFDWSVRQAGSLDEATAHFTTEDTPPRVLRAQGVRDFRDLGGERTSDGRRVRQNVLLRSAPLRETVHGSRSSQVVADGIAAMQAEFAIRTDVDLRSVRGSFGSALGPDVRWKHIPFVSGRRIDQAVRGREPFARIFDIVSDPQNHPVLFETSDDGSETDTLFFLLDGLVGVPEDILRSRWTSSSAVCQELCEYLGTLPGKTLAQRIEAYAAGCGIKTEEIAAFREMMTK